jgi:hypothetical protein
MISSSAAASQSQENSLLGSGELRKSKNRKGEGKEEGERDGKCGASAAGSTTREK